MTAGLVGVCWIHPGFFLFVCFCRIYIVHDEVKDKAFELELSWVGESKNLSVLIWSLFTGLQFLPAHKWELVN